jgi:hypothetical protein
MSTIFDRLNNELEAFGRRAQAALDEGKLQIEIMRLKRQRDAVARDLGLLVHRRERAADVEPKRVDTLMIRLDGIEEELASLERQAAAARGEATSVNEEPAPVSAEPVPAEDVTAP